jgi:hypothetical protein
MKLNMLFVGVWWWSEYFASVNSFYCLRDHLWLSRFVIRLKNSDQDAFILCYNVRIPEGHPFWKESAWYDVDISISERTACCTKKINSPFFYLFLTYSFLIFLLPFYFFFFFFFFLININIFNFFFFIIYFNSL